MCARVTNRRQVSHHEERCESGVKEEGDPLGGCSGDAQAADAGRVSCGRKNKHEPKLMNKCILMQMDRDHVLSPSDSTGSNQHHKRNPTEDISPPRKVQMTFRCMKVPWGLISSNIQKAAQGSYVP